MNVDRILTQKKSSEAGDVSSSRKRQQQVRQQPECCYQLIDVFLCEKYRITKEQHVEELVKCVTKTANDLLAVFVKEAATQKQDQHILFKVHDTDLAARNAHCNASCRRDYTQDDDRHHTTIKDANTIEEQALHKTTSFSLLKAAAYRDERMTILREKYETGTFYKSSLWR